MQKITPCLWLDTEAEAAAQYYLDIFDDAKIVNVSRYGEGVPDRAGTVLTVELDLFGQRFTLLNGGPEFTFSEAISFQVSCADQAEVDRYWAALTAGAGEEGPCGWLKDRYGLSWQIIPERLPQLLTDPDPARAQRATAAMMTMRKLDVAALERAADNG
jgi:predicted 3-demethylubiquinone-9 3-methyltransferase (glyoxalase superfamily)